MAEHDTTHPIEQDIARHRQAAHAAGQLAGKALAGSAHLAGVLSPLVMNLVGDHATYRVTICPPATAMTVRLGTDGSATGTAPPGPRRIGIEGDWPDPVWARVDFDHVFNLDFDGLWTVGGYPKAVIEGFAEGFFTAFVGA